MTSYRDPPTRHHLERYFARIQRALLEHVSHTGKQDEPCLDFAPTYDFRRGVP